MTILQHLPVLACTGFALLLSRRAGLLPSIALFVVTGLVLFVLFVSVLAGLLLPATVLILAAGVLALIYESYRLYAAKSIPPLPMIVMSNLSALAISGPPLEKNMPLGIGVMTWIANARSTPSSTPSSIM